MEKKAKVAKKAVKKTAPKKSAERLEFEALLKKAGLSSWGKKCGMNKLFKVSALALKKGKK